MEQPTNNDAALVERGLNDCQTRCAAQVRTCERRIGNLETGATAMQERMTKVERESAVRETKLDSSSKIVVAVIVAIGAILQALLVHFKW